MYMNMIHKDANGKAKCGASQRGWNFSFALTNVDHQVTCKRCKNERSYKIEVLPLKENFIGKVFHYSFGYDMTLNVYAKVIKQTEKMLIAQECSTCVTDDCGKGAGRAMPGEVKKDGDVYKITLRRKTNKWGVSESWKGMGRYGCDLWDGKANYHNSWD